ncbi:MAG: DUF4340 domain-containing protein [Anaerolineaceae bacterium]
MVKKSTWVVIVIFAVLVVALIMVEKFPVGPLKGTPTPTMQPALLDSSLKQQIININIQGGTEPFTLERAGDTWVFSKDHSVNVLQSAANEMVDVLFSLDTKSVVDPTTPMETMGLVEPSIIFTINIKDGQAQKVTIGGITPTSSGYFAQINQDQPIVISTYAVESLIRFINPEGLMAETPTPEASPKEVTPTP